MRYVRLVSRHQAHQDVERRHVVGHRWHQRHRIAALQLADLTQLQVSKVSRLIVKHGLTIRLACNFVVVVVTHLVSSGRLSPPRHLSDSVLLVYK